METQGRSLHQHVKESEVKIADEEVTMKGVSVGGFFAWMRRNVVSVDDPVGQIAPMYCCSFVREEGNREEIQSKT